MIDSNEINLIEESQKKFNNNNFTFLSGMTDCQNIEDLIVSKDQTDFWLDSIYLDCIYELAV